MGLSSFPVAAEGVLPVLVMNTVLSVALLKNTVRFVLQVMCPNWIPPQYEPDLDEFPQENARERRISKTQFKCLFQDTPGSSSSSSRESRGAAGRTRTTMECCVCLCRFEDDEEVSELSCKHFFHKACLDKWFDNNHSTCPLCRSIL